MTRRYVIFKIWKDLPSFGYLAHARLLHSMRGFFYIFLCIIVIRLSFAENVKGETCRTVEGVKRNGDFDYYALLRTTPHFQSTASACLFGTFCLFFAGLMTQYNRVMDNN